MNTVWQLCAAEECIWDVSADWRRLLCFFAPVAGVFRLFFLAESPIALVLCDLSVETLFLTPMPSNGELNA